MSNSTFVLIFLEKAEFDYEEAYHWYELQEKGL